MSSATESDDTPEGAVDAVPEKDDVKRRFREALERKSGRQSDGSGTGEAGEHAKVHGAHGPAHTQRQFRRKSGG